MIHLREYTPTQTTVRFVATKPVCANALPARMTKPVIVAKARMVAEDAL
jgi:hypothetical protein